MSACPDCGMTEGHSEVCPGFARNDPGAPRCPDCEGIRPYHTRTCHYAEKLVADILPAGRHPNSERFHRLLKLAGVMHDRKQADYGTDTDPFSNVRGSDDWGIPPWLGAMVRGDDKDKRLQTFAQRGTLANEGVLDAFLDGAVYRLISACLWMEENDPEGEALKALEAMFSA